MIQLSMAAEERTKYLWYSNPLGQGQGWSLLW